MTARENRKNEPVTVAGQTAAQTIPQEELSQKVVEPLGEETEQPEDASPENKFTIDDLLEILGSDDDD